MQLNPEYDFGIADDRPIGNLLSEGRSGRDGRNAMLVASSAVVLLVANLALLLFLRSVVLAEGAPTDLEVERKMTTEAAQAYSLVCFLGMVYVPTLTVFAIGFAWASWRSGERWARRVSVVATLLAPLLLFASVGAAGLWLSFGTSGR